MKILFCDLHDHSNILNWSGTTRSISKLVEDMQNVEVVYLDDLYKEYSTLCVKLYNLMSRVTGKKYLSERSTSNLKLVGKKINQIVLETNIDAVFTVSSLVIPFIEKVPVYLYTDACFADMVDYYSYFTNISKYSLRECHKYEKYALEKCTHIFYSSEWARTGACKAYNIPKEKISVIRFGANLENYFSEDKIESIISARVNSLPIKLLFVGVDWERKGGDIALDAVALLRTMGIECILTIVGANPILSDEQKKYCYVEGFVDKTSKEGMKKMEELFEENHFFILPTKSECTPIVFAESSAYALPVITNSTGGCASMVKDGVSGIVLPEKSTALAYANAIKNLVSDFNKYENLCRTAYTFYLSDLNWNVIKEKIENVLGGD